MAILVGFIIAVIIALTGVGAGTITAPLLILFLHVPADIAVGTALAYSALVKVIIAPVQVVRKQVNYRVLTAMLLGGLPGVVIGSLLFGREAHKGNLSLLYWVLGAIIIFTSSWHIFRYFFPSTEGDVKPNRLWWLGFLMFPVGAEVGFSSSGAGALGTVALLTLTSLPAAQVVGTDLVFGLGIALIGSGIHMIGGTYNGALLLRLALGGIGGAIVGSSIAPHVRTRTLRLILSGCLLFLGVEFCYRAAQF